MFLLEQVADIQVETALQHFSPTMETFDTA